LHLHPKTNADLESCALGTPGNPDTCLGFQQEPPGRIDDDDLNRLWKELKLCMKIHPGTVQGLGRNLVTFLNKVDGTWTFTRESSFVEELDGWQASSRKHLVPEEEILIALHR
jgi:hypothetical protein